MSRPPPPACAPTTLVLFCRRPAPGHGKQRLARHLGTTAALDIAEALLECALEDARAWPGPWILCPSRPEDAPWATRLAGATGSVLAQGGGNLGERLNAVDAQLRERGHSRVLFIGSDAPSLRTQILGAAAQALAHADVVLAPAADGGVILMGSRLPWPPLAALPWSEPTLGAMLQRHCRDSGFTVTEVEGSYDVDEPADIDTAIAALSRDERSARRRLRERLLATRRAMAQAGAGAAGP